MLCFCHCGGLIALRVARKGGGGRVGGAAAAHRWFGSDPPSNLLSLFAAFDFPYVGAQVECHAECGRRQSQLLRLLLLLLFCQVHLNGRRAIVELRWPFILICILNIGILAMSAIKFELYAISLMAAFVLFCNYLSWIAIDLLFTERWIYMFMSELLTE